MIYEVPDCKFSISFRDSQDKLIGLSGGLLAMMVIEKKKKLLSFIAPENQFRIILISTFIAVHSEGTDSDRESLVTNRSSACLH